MYPWTHDPNDPKKLIVTDDRGHREQVAYCASPAVANLILHRCDSQPALLEACRMALRELEEVFAALSESAIKEYGPLTAPIVGHITAAIAAADPTTKE